MRRGRVRGVTPDAVIRSVVPGDTRKATATSLPAAQITAADSDTYLNAGWRENLSGSWSWRVLACQSKGGMQCPAEERRGTIRLATCTG